MVPGCEWLGEEVKMSTAIAWRFDQGRLDYLQFDEVKRIARALVAVDGINKPTMSNDTLRQVLATYSSRPFLPESYTVWRNYKRTFGCLMLVAEVAEKFICSDLAKQLATDDEVNVDDYLTHFSTRFYYPSPVFEGFDSSATQVFPVAAIIKFLVAESLIKSKNFVTVDEIGTYLVANQVTGLESIDFYAVLKPRAYSGNVRQLRELLRFISQFSFLKWSNSALYLEASNKEEMLQIEQALTPHIQPRQTDAGAEILNLGSGFKSSTLQIWTAAQIGSVDAEFTEGSKVRVTHLRTERSAKLKELYFSHTVNPHLCDMCAMDTVKRYPWAERLVEVHHLLPLGSPLRVEERSTSIQDVVGLCPSCHRATHKFYGRWLHQHQAKDFAGFDEARAVYQTAKQQIVLS